MSFTVNAAPTYSIALTEEGDSDVLNSLTFDWRVRGNTEKQPSEKQTPDTRTITISNTGNQQTVNLQVVLTGDDASLFTLSTTAPIASIAEGASDSFTVTPIMPSAGFSDGTYTATVTVSGDNSISASFNVSFTVYTAATFTNLLGIMAADKTAGIPTADYTLPSGTETYTAALPSLTSTNCPAIVTIHGGGRNITGDGSDNSIVVGAGITLTVTNLRLHNLKLAVDDNGTLELGDGLFMSGTSGGSRVSVLHGGELVMREGAHITQGTYGSVVLGTWGSNTSAAPPKFTMLGGKISGATAQGGVYMRAANSVFNMSGGEISGNICTSTRGGGVRMEGVGSTFTMSGTAKISGNQGNWGGGVNLYGSNTVFTMNGGEISGNYANQSGSGVALEGPNSKFTMTDGTIHDNTAEFSGGGVMLNDAYTEFFMEGGEIINNYAIKWGGGVFLGTTAGKFTMNGGIIYDNRAHNDNQPGKGGGGVYIEKGTLAGNPHIGVTPPTPITNGGWIYGNKDKNNTTDDVYPLPASSAAP